MKAEAESAAEEKRSGGEPQALGAGSLARPSKEPDPKVQRNFTDPDSRVLLTKDGFIQGYNAASGGRRGQAKLIVAHGLTQSMSDCPQLVPLVDAVRANSSDASPGRFRRTRAIGSEDNLSALATRKIHAHVATGRAKHPGRRPRARSAAR